MFSFFKEGVDYKKFIRFYERYERYLIPASLLVGIIVDAILFSSVDFVFAFVVLTLHFLVSGMTIAFIHLYNAGYFRLRGLRLLRVVAPLILQYTFGALLSGFLIFYWFSSTFTASWPFILIIVALILSNDLLKRYYLWLYVQVGVYFFITFSLGVLILPFIFKSVSVAVFLAGGILSLFIIALYLYLLSRYLPRVKESATRFMVIVGIIFIGMNSLYFTNIIPPIPLTLWEAELAHSVERISGDYLLEIEDTKISDLFWLQDRIRVTDGGRAFFFSSVFAPAWLGTDIVHHWQYYDDAVGQWRTRTKVAFPIVGGREEGYRGYSFINDPQPGRWRVLVENSRGQVIGKDNFRVIKVNGRVNTVERVY